MNIQKYKNFMRMLTPKHVATFGGNDAGVVIKETLRRGYQGQIWAVNPKRTEIENYPCYKNAESLPAPPDAAFIAVPSDTTIEIVRHLNRLGAGGAVIYSAGFSEIGTQGKALEQELIEAAGDMPLIGPNCYGMINYIDGVALWPFSHRGDRPDEAGVAILTQSGMISADITMNQRSLPISYMVAAGNQANMRLEDFINIFSENPKVNAIGVHIEGIRDIQNFIDAAYKAHQNNTPIVVLKTGTSKIGAGLTISHTGSLSGADDAYQALFDRLSIIRTHSLPEMLETLKFLNISGIPKGDKMIGFTCSGGGATLLADYAEKIGLNFSAIAESQKPVLSKILPPIATISNPLDYTTPIWGDYEKTHPVFKTAIGTDYDIAISLIDFPHPDLPDHHHYYLNDALAFADAVHEAGIVGTLCATLHESMNQEIRALFTKRKIAPMQGLCEALDAIAHALFYRKRHDEILHEMLQELNLQVIQTPRDPHAGKRFLSEADGKQILAKDKNLARYLLPYTRLQADNHHHLNEWINEIGAPFVLKISNDKIAHKTEWGGGDAGVRFCRADYPCDDANSQKYPCPRPKACCR